MRIITNTYFIHPFQHKFAIDVPAPKSTRIFKIKKYMTEDEIINDARELFDEFVSSNNLDSGKINYPNLIYVLIMDLLKNGEKDFRDSKMFFNKLIKLCSLNKGQYKLDVKTLMKSVDDKFIDVSKSYHCKIGKYTFVFKKVILGKMNGEIVLSEPTYERFYLSMKKRGTTLPRDLFNRKPQENTREVKKENTNN